MKQAHCIYQNDDHRWLAIARDPTKPGYLIDTNEYVVMDGEQALLCDPGGIEIFPAVFSALSAECDPTKLAGIFASHQDPDIISSLALWLEFKPDLKCYTSWLWQSFLPHFGGSESRSTLFRARRLNSRSRISRPAARLTPWSIFLNISGASSKVSLWLIICSEDIFFLENRSSAINQSSPG